MRYFLDGQFFADWPGSIELLAKFSGVDVSCLSADPAELAGLLVTQNNAAFEQAMAGLTADYPPSEINSWERQRAEALAWDADQQAATPWIDIAAHTRGIDRGEYLARTLAKVHLFAQASAFLVGRRQALDDAIRQAETVADLQAIVIDYTLPGAP
ncbi:hypothetical protein [Pseudomonas abyssi]|uniref:hypothetical protein n=1 Tax=Pseudomonas abyssi TaxID=170540 RepID=UPI003C7DEA53